MNTIHLHPRPMDQFDALQRATEPDWVWRGYLARGAVTLLTSQWQGGKTTLLAGLLRALGPGGAFLGRPCPAAAALVVSAEQTERWADRLRAIPVGPHAQLVSRPIPGRPTPQQWDDLVRQIEALRHDSPLDLLAVDPLALFLPGSSESDPNTLLDFLRPLRRLAEAGVAVLVLRHPRRERGTDGSAARGSRVLLEQVDVTLDLHRCGNPISDAHLRRLVGRSRFPDTPRTLVYEWTPGTPDFRRVDDPSLIRLREHWEVVRALLAARSAAVTHKELRADWPSDRLPPSAGQLYEWLGRAADEGWVQRTGRGTRNDPFRFRLPAPNERIEVSPLPMNQDGCRTSLEEPAGRPA